MAYDITFTARDTVFGILTTPITLKRYTYAGGDPLGDFDLDGHSFGGWVKDTAGRPLVRRAVGSHVRATVTRPARWDQTKRGIAAPVV